MRLGVRSVCGLHFHARTQPDKVLGSIPDRVRHRESTLATQLQVFADNRDGES